MRNELEKALTDLSNGQLDFYLENESTETIRADIEEIKQKSILSTTSGELKKRVLEALNNAK